jgi:phosphotriesterase-related protein
MASVVTVTGPVAARDLGFTLIHEHIFLDLTRDVLGRNSLLNDPELAYRELLLYKQAGGSTLVDQTTGGLRGHDHDITPTKHALAIRDMARRVGLQIVLGAGWYREPYYERRLWRAKTDQIAEELERDVTQGIDGTDVRAGLLGEIGSHFTWISPVEERVFRAVARAHRRTGVTIATHALNSPVGLDQLDILQEEGVDPRRVIVGHAHSYPVHEYHVALAKRGAFLSFDRMGFPQPYEHERMLQGIKMLVDAGLVGHVVLSQDVCWRTDYVAYGGRGYAFVADGLRPELRQLGISDEAYHRMTVDNPRRALAGEP